MKEGGLLLLDVIDTEQNTTVYDQLKIVCKNVY